ncbi:MAG: DNA internalization-related competence protein ComEC/Rec2 [Bacteroidetes bacterium]|nr:DNA internalization-related competence protein ComEC/Rec2 [Bacteroidota bacterium]
MPEAEKNKHMKDHPIIIFTVAFIIGILLEPVFQVSILIVLILTLILFSFLLISRLNGFFYKIKIILSVISLILISSLGNLTTYFNQVQFNPEVSSLYKEKNVSVSGTINTIELIRENEILFLLDASNFITKDENINDDITFLCKLRGGKKGRNEFYNTMKPGYLIEVKATYTKGKGRRNPGEFDYNSYLKSKGITGILIIKKFSDIIIVKDKPNFFKNSIFQVRKIINEQINSLHGNKTASLLRGLLLADRREIDQETKIQFINSGVVHVLAVSGLHVGFIAFIFIILFGRFNIYFRSVSTIVGLLCFMFLTGVPPSVFRATVMALVIITAFLTNRTTNIFNSLAIAALIILVINPNEIYSPGFQLSFSAVLAIGVIYPLISNAINKLKIESKLIRFFLLFIAVSFAAQIGTLPFTLLYFGKLSVIALLANLIVIPTIGFIISLSIITLITQAVFPSLAIYYAATNDAITNLLLDFINFTGQLGFSHIKIRGYSIYDIFIFYFFLIFVLYFLRKVKSKLAFSIVIIFVIVNIYLLSSLDNKKLLPDNVLSILMIDVGQGDAILIKFPDNTIALIDAGQATFYFDYGERVILPLLDYLDIDKIDYGFISHLDLDHYGGFVSLIQNGIIKEIYKPVIDSSLSKDVKFEKFLKERKVPFNYYNCQSLMIGNCRLFTLSDKDEAEFYKLSSNNKSGVMKLVYGKKSFLFTGDVEKRVEKILINDFEIFLDVDVLKVAHHGSKTSTSDEFLKYTSPQYALISAGIKNKFGHPAENVISKFRKNSVKILRTDESGAVLLWCDGEKIFVEDWR